MFKYRAMACACKAGRLVLAMARACKAERLVLAMAHACKAGRMCVFYVCILCVYVAGVRTAPWRAPVRPGDWYWLWHMPGRPGG